MVSFLITFVLLLTLLLLPAIADLGVVGDAERPRRGAALGLDRRALPAAARSGLVDTADLAYFAVVIGSVLLLTKAAVESVRWR